MGRRRIYVALLAAGLIGLGASAWAKAPPRVFGTPDRDCRPACAARCEAISCNGLNAAQCTRARQSCRMACSSRC
ncbi:MAG: hypothetical protein ACT4N2_03780 [Hyphomicrobium sp.]